MIHSQNTLLIMAITNLHTWQPWTGPGETHPIEAGLTINLKERNALIVFKTTTLLNAHISIDGLVSHV